MDINMPTETIFYSIEKAIKAYRKFAQKRIRESGKDITINQMLVLIQLSDNPDVSQVELAEFLFKDYASITRMIELMVNKGYLDRSVHRHDRRKSQLNITLNGRELVKDLSPVIRENRKQALQGLGRKEIIQLNELLNRVTLNCELEKPQNNI
ncbi:MAG TPA: MarR family winged helix-turn-helix transcriptional regulator [Eudoraea sp.]|nr:MarR family winged helix-turn-helix transcriptional regulator [Eudoraea sp.]